MNPPGLGADRPPAVTGRSRLDSLLVGGGLARSRGQAGELVRAGRVLVDGVPAARAATPVTTDARVEVLGDPAADFASRAGDKLDHALTVFASGGLLVGGRACLDAGASTGGFTDVLLRRGAATVLAVDVGHDQLRPVLRADPRVTALDGTDIRQLAAPSDPAAGTTVRRPGTPASLVVADLSFISLRTVFAALASLTDSDGDLLTLVKPQFEVGRKLLKRTGVVRDPALRTAALVGVAGAAAAAGFGLAGGVRCARTGRTGNIEFVLWWRRDAPAADPDQLRLLGVQEAGGGGERLGETVSTGGTTLVGGTTPAGGKTSDGVATPNGETIENATDTQTGGIAAGGRAEVHQ